MEEKNQTLQARLSCCLPEIVLLEIGTRLPRLLTGAMYCKVLMNDLGCRIFNLNKLQSVISTVT